MAARSRGLWVAPDGQRPDVGALVRVFEHGACRHVDPDLFFPHPSSDPEPALAVCAACPVRGECLATFGPLLEYGVVGGLTAEQRHHRRAAADVSADRDQDRNLHGAGPNAGSRPRAGGRRQPALRSGPRTGAPSLARRRASEAGERGEQR